MPRKASAAPYWLEGGTEICAICHQPYLLENGLRCAACDEGVCAHCAQREPDAVEAFCSTCHAAEGER
jgi:hypothetical protein